MDFLPREKSVTIKVLPRRRPKHRLLGLDKICGISAFFREMLVPQQPIRNPEAATAALKRLVCATRAKVPEPPPLKTHNAALD